MLAVQLLNSFREQFERLETERLDVIDRAAAAVAGSVMVGRGTCTTRGTSWIGS